MYNDKYTYNNRLLTIIEKLYKNELLCRLGSYILCANCCLKDVIKGTTEGRLEVTGRRWRRCKQLLVNIKEKRGYWKLKQEVVDRAV
jgi:hypothetical protein